MMSSQSAIPVRSISSLSNLLVSRYQRHTLTPQHMHMSIPRLYLIALLCSMVPLVPHKANLSRIQRGSIGVELLAKMHFLGAVVKKPMEWMMRIVYGNG